MTLEQVAQIAQIVGTAGAIVSLLFVASQIRHNTRALERNEHNTAMTEWTVIRQAMVTNRGVAELMSTGLRGERALDAVDELRLSLMLQECTWASFHVWEKTKRGVFPCGTFEATAGTYLCELLQTARGSAWWQGTQDKGFLPAFVADVNAMLDQRGHAASGAGRATSR